MLLSSLAPWLPKLIIFPISMLAGVTGILLVVLFGYGWSLWVTDHAALCPSDTIILTFFGVKIKEFQGKTSLQNSIHSTRIAFKPQFIEAMELKRYRIKVGVVDATGSASFVIFDRAATLLFNKECSELVNQIDQDDSKHDYPPHISDLVNGQFMFKVDAKVNSSVNFEPTYTVKRLTNDAEVINKFKFLNSHKEIGLNGGYHYPSKEMINDLDKGLTHECNEVGLNVASEPESLLSNVDKIGSSGGKDNGDNFNNLKMKESSNKALARKDFEILDGKNNLKLLKRIKIEKP